MSDNPLQNTSDQTPQTPRQCHRVAAWVRWSAIIAWCSWLLSAGLLWIEHRAGVLHPTVWGFGSLLVLTALASISEVTGTLWLMSKGFWRRSDIVWCLTGLIPAGLWLARSLYVLRLVGLSQALPKNVASDIAGVAIATLFEGWASATYPHRLESPRLVMFYDDRVTRPQRDLDAMEQHLIKLETKTGRPLRSKIHWVRGQILGRGNMANRGIAMGSSKSPADWATADHPDHLSVDRHELAHAVIHQFQPPDANPPTLFIEGWAEAQAGVPETTRARWARQSRELWHESTGAGPETSYLSDLTSPARYHRVDGPVYNVGGALAQYLLKKYGTERFLNFYFAIRPGQFDAACRTQLGVDLQALEADFWAEVNRLVES